MQSYRSEAEWDVTRWERNYAQLSEQHKYVQTTITVCALHHWMDSSMSQTSLCIAFFWVMLSSQPCNKQFRMLLNLAHASALAKQMQSCTCMHRALLPHQPAKFAAARNCIHNNFLFIKSLLAVHQDSQDSPSHLSSANSAAAEHAKKHKRIAPGDMEKVRSGR